MSALDQPGSSTQQEILRCRRPRKELRNPPTGVDLVPVQRTLLERLGPRRLTLRSERRRGKGNGLARPFRVPQKGCDRRMMYSDHLRSYLAPNPSQTPIKAQKLRNQQTERNYRLRGDPAERPNEQCVKFILLINSNN